MRWYTASNERHWSITDGISQLLKDEVLGFRNQYNLRKTDTLGVEVGSGEPVPHRTRAGTVHVVVSQLDWRHTDGWGYEAHMQFRFRVRVYRQNGLPRFLAKWLRIPPIREIFNQKVIMTFPDNYPNSPPQIKIDDRRYRNPPDQHSHHLFNDGTLCIISGSGDWDKRRSTSVTAFGVFVEWVAWHTAKYGW